MLRVILAGWILYYPTRSWDVSLSEGIALLSARMVTIYLLMKPLVSMNGKIFSLLVITLTVILLKLSLYCLVFCQMLRTRPCFFHVFFLFFILFPFVVFKIFLLEIRSMKSDQMFLNFYTFLLEIFSWLVAFFVWQWPVTSQLGGILVISDSTGCWSDPSWAKRFGIIVLQWVMCLCNGQTVIPFSLLPTLIVFN